MAGWIRSKRALTIFSYSAWTIVGWAVIIVFMVSPMYSLAETHLWSNVLVHVIFSPIAFLAVPACLVILVGMAVFCAREDDSPKGTKILWYILFLSTACFGAAIYFFAVYRKRVQEAAV